MDQELPDLPGDPIGVGRTAEVYEWGADRVLKLLWPSLPREWIMSEAEKTASARAAGAATPAVHEQIEVGGRFGLVFDRVGSVSMLEQIMASPWRVWRWGGELAGIHAGGELGWYRPRVDSCHVETGIAVIRTSDPAIRGRSGCSSLLGGARRAPLSV